MSVLRHQLAPGEELLKVQIETSEFGKHAFDAIARLFTLQRMVDLAQTQGFVITQGPEITEIHRPEMPGDPAWMIATAVARPM